MLSAVFLTLNICFFLSATIKYTHMYIYVYIYEEKKGNYIEMYSICDCRQDSCPVYIT